MGKTKKYRAKKLLSTMLFVVLLFANVFVVFAQSDNTSGEEASVATKAEKDAKAVCPPTRSEFERLKLCDLRYQCAKYVYEMADDPYVTANEYIYDANCDLFLNDRERRLSKLDSVTERIESSDFQATDNSGIGGRYKKYYADVLSNGLDKPFSSEFFDVTNTKTGLVADGQKTVFDQGSGNPILDFIVRLVEVLVSFIGLATLIVVVIGAYFLLTAAGEDEQISKGKDIIKLGLTGMLIAIFSYMIITFVQAIIY